MAKKGYIPVEDIDIPFFVINWGGFFTNTTLLEDAGWRITLWYNPHSKKYRVKFYHPELLMTFGVETENINTLAYKQIDLRLISIGGEFNRKPKLRRTKKYQPEDIGALLEVITKLQAPSRQKYINQMELPKAEVVELVISRGKHFR